MEILMNEIDDLNVDVRVVYCGIIFSVIMEIINTKFRKQIRIKINKQKINNANDS